MKENNLVSVYTMIEFKHQLYSVSDHLVLKTTPKDKSFAKAILKIIQSEFKRTFNFRNLSKIKEFGDSIESGQRKHGNLK